MLAMIQVLCRIVAGPSSQATDGASLANSANSLRINNDPVSAEAIGTRQNVLPVNVPELSLIRLDFAAYLT